MPKYQVEALRTIRVIQGQHECVGHTAQAEQMRKVGDQVEKMVAEIAALKAAARPVGKRWLEWKEWLSDSDEEIWPDENITFMGARRGEGGIAAAQLDNLARLCGEE